MRSRLVVASKSLGSPVGWLGVLLIATILLVAPSAVAAEEHGEHEAAEEQHEATAKHEEGGEAHEGGEEHGEGHHFHKNHFAVIISATEAVEDHGEEHNGHDDGHGDPHAEIHSEGSSGGKDDPDFTIGIDYERRFTQLFGFGGMIDWIAEGRREFLFGPTAFLHPWAGSKFWVAPLAERVRETGDWALVVRVGAGWDIPVGKSGKYSIAPNINYDITEEHELWVVGLAIGRGF